MNKGNIDENIALELYNVTKKYKSKENNSEEIIILDDINLNYESEYPPILKGEFVIIRGQSGGGKSRDQL